MSLSVHLEVQRIPTGKTHLKFKVWSEIATACINHQLQENLNFYPTHHIYDNNNQAWNVKDVNLGLYSYCSVSCQLIIVY